MFIQIFVPSLCTSPEGHMAPWWAYFFPGTYPGHLWARRSSSRSSLCQLCSCTSWTTSKPSRGRGSKSSRGQEGIGQRSKGASSSWPKIRCEWHDFCYTCFIIFCTTLVLSTSVILLIGGIICFHSLHVAMLPESSLNGSHSGVSDPEDRASRSGDQFSRATLSVWREFLGRLLTKRAGELQWI